MAGGLPSPSILSSSNSQRLINSSSHSTEAGLNFGSEEFPQLISSSSGSKKLGVSKDGGNSDSLKSPVDLSYIDRLKNTNQATASTKLSIDETKMVDGESTAVFTSGELKSHILDCESYVVGYFVGKKPYFPYVKESLISLWKLKGDFSMTVHGEQFLFKFTQEEDRKNVIELGSVFIAKTLFLIRPWSFSLEQNTESITSVPIWVILKQVPLHLWNQLGLSRIASIVGTPIMTDTPTALKTRMSYARVLVEVAADCTFPTELPVQIDNVKFVVKAEYPWRPSSCSHCKSFAHSSAKCSLNPAPKVSTKWVPKVKVIVTTPVVVEEVTTSKDNCGTENCEVASPPIEELTNLPATLKVVEGRSKPDGETSLPISNLSKGNVSKNAPSQQEDEQWTVYTSKKKKSAIKGCKLQVSTCNPNPFSVLNSCPETAVAYASASFCEESLKDMEANDIIKETEEERVPLQHIESEDNFVVSEQVGGDTGGEACKFQDSDSDTSSDVESNGVTSDEEDSNNGKTKTINEVSQKKPWSKDKNMDMIMRFASSLNLPSGQTKNSRETEAIIGGIVESFHSKQIKELGPCNEDLGRGKRTPLPKKKF